MILRNIISLDFFLMCSSVVRFSEDQRMEWGKDQDLEMSLINCKRWTDSIEAVKDIKNEDPRLPKQIQGPVRQ